MFVIKEHIVPEGISNIRLIDYVLKVFPEIQTRSSMKKTLNRGEILLDELPAKSGIWIEPGQNIKLIDLERNPPKPLDLKLDIVYEDEHIAIIIKPPGIEVSGNKYNTIQNALISNIQQSKEQDALKWPKPVHRLDYPTSGLLLIAKTQTSITNLNKQFEDRNIKKRYIAIISGYLGDNNQITDPINGMEAISSYEIIRHSRSLKTEWITEVSLYPVTGRKHQLRIHMAGIGHPIVGDKNYGKGPILKGKGLFLAALEIDFDHPITNSRLTFSIDPPKKFNTFMETQQINWEKFNNQE